MAWMPYLSDQAADSLWSSCVRLCISMHSLKIVLCGAVYNAMERNQWR